MGSAMCIRDRLNGPPQQIQRINRTDPNGAIAAISFCCDNPTHGAWWRPLVIDDAVNKAYISFYWVEKVIVRDGYRFHGLILEPKLLKRKESVGFFFTNVVFSVWNLKNPLFWRFFLFF